MEKDIKEYIKTGYEPKQMLRIKAVHAELENKSLANTIRVLVDGGLDSHDTLITLTDIVTTHLNKQGNNIEEVIKEVKAQANRIAQLEIKTLVETKINNALFIHYMKFGSLSEEEIERISISTKRELFLQLNKKKDKED